jgi:RNase P/RNase MRP subunit p30
MKRKFVDLNLQLPIHDLDKTRKMLEKAHELGYDLVAANLSPDTDDGTITYIKKLCASVGIDFATRVELIPKTRHELLGHLRRLRRKFEVVSVTCVSKVVARQAAKDRRVDLLFFPRLDSRKRFFDSQEAELASNALASLEIRIKPLLLSNGVQRTRLLSYLRKEAVVALNYGVPIVISSEASETWHMRKPRELAVLATLFDLDFPTGLDAVSKFPLSTVKRNREKLKSNFIAPGIRLVKRGKNCH